MKGCTEYPRAARPEAMAQATDVLPEPLEAPATTMRACKPSRMGRRGYKSRSPVPAACCRSRPADGRLKYEPAGRQELDGAGRIMILVNGLTVRGNIRLQKYGFLASRMYGAELRPLGFYSDWTPGYYGPYSRQLREDLDAAVEAGLVRVEHRELADGNPIMHYRLSSKGARMLSALSKDHEEIIGRLHDEFAGLNKKSIEQILRQVYADHPAYAPENKDEKPAGSYEIVKFSPGLERDLHAAKSGDHTWKKYTIDEFRRHIDCLVNS